MSGPYGSGTFGSDLFGGTATLGTTTTVTGTGITVTANTIATPPRFEIEIATPDGAPMLSVTLVRTVQGSTANTRVQPSSGLSFRYVEDYEEPWGEDVVFAALVQTATAGWVTYTAPAVQLNPWAAWAIHPLTPAISFCLDRQDAGAPGVTGIDPIARPSQSTQHQILGAARPITTRVGPRASSRGVLRVATVTGQDEDNLWTVVDDQTPLLIQFPRGWGINWEFGYYDIGDVTATRPLQWSGDPRQEFSLPFTVVDPPAGNQQSTWDYPSLLHDFADYPALLAAFTDYRALLADDRT